MVPIPSPVPAPAHDAVAPGISRAIYGMPMFVTLVARDLDATTNWYTDGLGFVVLFSMPGPDGRPALVHLRRWQFQDILVRPATAPGGAGSTMTVSFAAVYGEIDDLAERARAHGGGTIDGPADTPWNTRDLTATDPDGNVVILTAARPPELADAAFSAEITERFRESG
jgi:catechol 2,3-dioxygenase-like lactoylglutathione lyase family enzyme